MFKACVGAGRANEGLRADWQRQLTRVHNECGFTYIRMHGLFCDDMGVYREDKSGRPEYNWQYIDELYDFLQSIGMKPFVELGFMPSALASGSQTIFWWRGNVTLPKDFNKWADFVRAFTSHLKERYGEDEVRTWYFEVWNEPNLDGFFSGSQQDYFRLYDVTAKPSRASRPLTASADRRRRAAAGFPNSSNSAPRTLHPWILSPRTRMRWIRVSSTKTARRGRCCRKTPAQSTAK